MAAGGAVDSLHITVDWGQKRTGEGGCIQPFESLSLDPSLLAAAMSGSALFTFLVMVAKYLTEAT